MSADPVSWLSRLGSLTDSFALLLEEADEAALARPVRACPEWDVRALAGHLGGVHAWAAHAVSHGSPDLPESAAPSGTGQPALWYRQQAEALLTTLAHAGPDGAAWTMGPPQGRALFWQRRQVHEARMHLWDARTALGLPDAIEPELALDGIREVRDVMYPRQVRLGRISALPGRLVLRPTEPDAAPVAIGADGGAEAVVSAPADVLLRLLWHREQWSDGLGDPSARELLAVAVAP